MYLALMVIEKAVGTDFEIPEYISGEDMSSIFFAFRESDFRATVSMAR